MLFTTYPTASTPRELPLMLLFYVGRLSRRGLQDIWNLKKNDNIHYRLKYYWNLAFPCLCYTVGTNTHSDIFMLIAYEADADIMTHPPPKKTWHLVSTHQIWITLICHQTFIITFTATLKMLFHNSEVENQLIQKNWG